MDQELATRAPKERLVGLMAGGITAGEGLMTIYRGTVVLKPTSWARRWLHLPADFRDTSGEVVMLEPRLLLPLFWMNCTLILGNGEQLVAVGILSWSRRPVRAELGRAGIKVRRIKSWVEIGWTRTRGF